MSAEGGDPAAGRGPAERSRWAWLEGEVDGASLAAFRVIFGLLLSAAAVRFLAHGEVQAHYLTPRVFFPMAELAWLRPLPGVGMYAVWGALAVLGLTLSLGLFTRASAGLFCALFTYAHAIDKTHYLNHYYLVSLLTALLVVLPSGRVASLDAWRRGDRRQLIPAWAVWLVRFQVGCVYFYGGVAKLKGDWLLRAMPLRVWLPSAADVPVLGPLLSLPETAWAMSWAGAAYDLSVPFLLLWSRSRPVAYLAVVVFHTVTGRLFNIGMFPLFMVGASLIFLPPSWPRELLGRGPAPRPLGVSGAPASLPGWARAALASYVALQALMPLRHWVYPGNVLWTEDGFRFAWNVMLIEKTGVVDFTLVDRATGRRHPVRTRDYLTPQQEKAMAAQPDLLLAFAHHLARTQRERGRDVAVVADSLMSLNGRPPARLVDPALDLGQTPETLGPRRWILPLP